MLCGPRSMSVRSAEMEFLDLGLTMEMGECGDHDLGKGPIVDLGSGGYHRVTLALEIALGVVAAKMQWAVGSGEWVRGWVFGEEVICCLSPMLITALTVMA